MKVLIQQSYQAGLHEGVAWAEHDRANHVPYAAGTAEIMEEIHGDNRGLRAFYLGALRGYRSVYRTLMNGRWGT